jgi:hypothetical protein
VPAFLEAALKHEASKKGMTGRKAAQYVYGTLNDIGAMHGSKETRKGAAMQAKHNAKVKAGSSGPKPTRFPKPGRAVKVTPQTAANQWAPPQKSTVKRAPFGGKAEPQFKAKAPKSPKERYPDAHAYDWKDNQ